MIIGTPQNRHIPPGQIIGSPPVFNRQQPPAPSKKESGDDKTVWAVNYVSDNSGCGFYRMVWPEQILSSKKTSSIRYVISSLKRMVQGNPWFYRGLNVVRIQRQVSDEHHAMFSQLRKTCDQTGTRLVYEIDDIPFVEDIPLYNRNRKSYANPKYRKNIEDMMNGCDEITVTTKFMRDYFRSKLKNQNITVIPNYIPRFWMDRFYDEKKLAINFERNKKKPVVLYSGCGGHYNTTTLEHEDDFTAIEPLVEKTVNDFTWVFFGGFPRKLVHLFKSGKVKWVSGVDVYDYPMAFDKIGAQVTIAPLLDNNFNKAKSNIKLTESGAWGIPCICQGGIVTYAMANHHFRTADELHDKIKTITKDSGVYMKHARKARRGMEKHWLEDNMGKWGEFYQFPYRDEKRLELNLIQ